MEFDFKYCIWSAENYNMSYITNHPKYIAHFEAIEKQSQLEIAQAQTVKVGDIVELEFVKNGYNANDDYTECWTEANLGDTVFKCATNEAGLIVNNFFEIILKKKLQN